MNNNLSKSIIDLAIGRLDSTREVDSKFNIACSYISRSNTRDINRVRRVLKNNVR